MQDLRVVALVADDTRADAHWRIVRPFTRLRERGIDARWCWLDADELPALPIGGAVVVLQRVTVKGRNRRQVNAWVDRLRAAGALAVVYEADDDIWSPAYLEYLTASGRIYSGDYGRVQAEAQAQIWAMQACDAVTVSTDPLAAVARQYTDAPVYVIPNAIDTEWFMDHLMPRPEWHDTVTIGWAGGRRPESDLESMAVAWGRISQRYPKVRFVVAGWQHDVIYQEIADLDRIIRLPWREVPDYPPAFQTTIGCCAAPSNAFSCCKSPIKAWEYALAGAAVVASPVPYVDCIFGRSINAVSTEQWEWHLANLIEQIDVRHAVASNLRRHVMAEHSLTGNLRVWTNVYSSIANREGARSGSTDLVVAR